MTPWRVVSVLVVPAATTAALATWWTVDAAAYAYRLYRDARRVARNITT